MIAKGFLADKVEIVPNGADTELFSPAAEAARQGLRTALGLPMKCFVVVCVGRKQVAKGLVTFLQAVEMLAARGIPVRGLCAGPIAADTLREDGYAQREAWRLSLIADRQGPADRYAGVAASTIGQYLPGCRCVALRLPIQGEQHPSVLIEGLATGCPVITSGIAGISESVSHQEPPILMDDAGDVREAAEHLFKIASYPENYLAMCRNGRDLARRKYDWRAISGQVERIYFSLC